MSEQVNKPATNVAAVIRRESERKGAVRTRTESFGGLRLKLAVIGRIEGYHLYWENDDEGSVEQLLHEGFEFVSPDEVSMQSHIVADTDIANRVSRYVGKKADGTPMRAFLLKISNEEWAEREQNRYDQANAWDNDIRAGRVQQDSGRYTPKGVSIALDTGIEKTR